MKKLLFMTLIFLSASALHGAATVAAPATTMLAHAQQTRCHTDLFLEAKRIISDSIHRMTPEEWENALKYEKEMDEITHALVTRQKPLPYANNPIITATRQALFKKTNCSESARYICQLFTGSRPDIVTQQKIFADNEYRGTFTDFAKKNGSHYQNRMAHILFTPSPIPLHVLFYVQCNGEGRGGHFYVIEIQSDGTTTFARIYQSWFGHYTLAEWLGIDPWNEQRVTPDDSTLYYLFGRGMKIPIGLVPWFTNVFDNDATFYIKMIDVPQSNTTTATQQGAA